jgi:hypothetical protein
VQPHDGAHDEAYVEVAIPATSEPDGGSLYLEQLLQAPPSDPGSQDRNRGVNLMMMDMTGMSSAMVVAMGAIWLLVLAFLVLGIAAFIKFLRS